MMTEVARDAAIIAERRTVPTFWLEPGFCPSGYCKF